MNYYNEIKTKLIENENYAKIKDYSKENHKVKTYFEIGKLLFEAGKHYGENIIKKYSLQLQEEVGKKYNERTLYGMRKFYKVFSNPKLNPLGSKLSWTHYRTLISIKDITKIKYYIERCIVLNLTKRELQAKIKNKEYERLDEQAKQKILTQENITIQDFIKNPILIKSQNKLTSITEKDLQNIILEDIPTFLEELGNNFSFIKAEK